MNPAALRSTPQVNPAGLGSGAEVQSLATLLRGLTPAHTSNHNDRLWMLHPDGLSFISILHQATTDSDPLDMSGKLSFISILHQTTTSECSGCTGQPLSFISILHQTTTLPRGISLFRYCLLSLFYIKPQRTGEAVAACHIVFYLYYTSNHNRIQLVEKDKTLSFISILHQTTTYTS